MNAKNGFVLCLAVVCAGLAAAASFARADDAALPPGVIVRQGGAEITLQDVDAFAQRMPPGDRPGFFDSPQRIQDMLSNLLLNKRLAAEARKRHLEASPEVRRQIELADEDVLARVRLTEYRNDLKLPDFAELANEKYLADPGKYVIKGEIKVEHVLITSKGRSEDEAKALAEEVERKAKADPAGFGKLVDAYSEDPSKQANHGLIDYSDPSRLDHAFVEAVDALHAAGDISPVVQSRFGYHVIKLLSRGADRQQPFAEVRAGIIRQLREDFLNKNVQQHVDELRNGKLDASPDLVASLRTRYLPRDAAAPATSSPGK